MSSNSSSELASNASQVIGSLPIELLPEILSRLSWRTGDLAACARVNSSWHNYAQLLLYERILLRDQLKLIKLFRSLAAHEHNARSLRIIEILVFPFGLRAEEQERLEVDMVRSLRAATHLSSLTWTRAGSLSDRVLLELFPHLRRLRRLSIMGNSRTWSPDLLIQSLRRPPRRKRCMAVEDPPRSGQYRLQQVVQAEGYDSDSGSDSNPGEDGGDEAEEAISIERFAITLPDRRMAAKLPALAERLGGQLKALSILSDHTTHVHDGVLKALAPHTPWLTELSLMGCKSVSGAGILALLRASRGGMLKLALESVPLHGDELRTLAPYVSQVRVLALTYPKPSIHSADYLRALADLVQTLHHLESFTFYAPSAAKAHPEDGLNDGDDGDDDADGDDRHAGAAWQTAGGGHRSDGLYPNGIPMSGPALHTAFLQRVLSSRGAQLRSLRLHGLGMSLEQLEMICTSACRTSLTDLVVHLYEYDPDAQRLSAALSNLAALRDLHILTSAHADMILTEQDLTRVADACPTTLRQIGFRHRVWMVDRSSYDRKRKVGSQLRPWDVGSGSGAYFFPEVLLVVRI